MAIIDLPKHETQVTNFCVTALATFSQEHSDIKISSIVLYSYPNYGTLIFCLDTLANALKPGEVKAKPGSRRFSPECPNFAFFEWRRMDIEEWREAYESDWIDGGEQLEIRTLSGKTILMGEDDGDEKLNKPVFELLVKAFRGMTDDAVAKALNQEPRMTVGVQIEESKYSKYWSLSNGSA